MKFKAPRGRLRSAVALCSLRQRRWGGPQGFRVPVPRTASIWDPPDARRGPWPFLPRSCPSSPVGVAAPALAQTRPLPVWGPGTRHRAPGPLQPRPVPAPGARPRPRRPRPVPAPARSLSAERAGRPGPRAPRLWLTGPRPPASAPPLLRAGRGPCPGLRPQRAHGPGHEERRGAQGQQRCGASRLAAHRPRATRRPRRAPGPAAARRRPAPGPGRGRCPRAAAPPVSVEQVEEEDGLVHVGGHGAEAGV